MDLDTSIPFSDEGICLIPIILLKFIKVSKNVDSQNVKVLSRRANVGFNKTV